MIEFIGVLISWLILERNIVLALLASSAAVSAFVFHAPPIVVFCFLKADQFLKCIPNGITVNRFRWVKILTRSEIAAE